MVVDNLIARENEQAYLEQIFKSKIAEFLVVYGRRRVGKTYLIKKFFKAKKCHFFHVTGIKDASLDEQLKEFAKAIGQTFYQGASISASSTWMDALDELTHAIKTVVKKEKVVLFLDEFPWMATKKSKLVQAIDYYWNQFWVDMPNLTLVVCGSSASWIIKTIIHHKGGLHNRMTRQLILKPFTLSQTKEFLWAQGCKYNNKQVLETYMALGGIPHYLMQVRKGISARQNLNNICFRESGLLLNEFDKLFSSLFEEAAPYLELIRTIGRFRYGIKRAELEKLIKLSGSGGRLSERLDDLETAGFIRSFLPMGHKRQGIYYRVIDEFCYFYLKWVEPEKQSLLALEPEHNYWLIKAKSASYNSWCGYSFEMVCYKNIAPIRKALNILDDARVGTWDYKSTSSDEQTGAQIDLIFDRTDSAVTLCEIKYTEKPFAIDKEYYHNMLNKVKAYRMKMKTDKQIFVAFISAAGLKETLYSEELVDAVVSLDDLFVR